MRNEEGKGGKDQVCPSLPTGVSSTFYVVIFANPERHPGSYIPMIFAILAGVNPLLQELVHVFRIWPKKIVYIFFIACLVPGWFEAKSVFELLLGTSYFVNCS